MKKKGAPLPTRQQLLDFIRDSGQRVGKRELARAFQLTGENKNILRELIRDLEKSGEIERGRGRRFGRAGAAPETAVVEIVGVDADGELLAKPLGWSTGGKSPRIYMAPRRRGEAALAVGDRVQARLRPVGNGVYQARAQRRITEGPAKVLGVYHPLGPSPEHSMRGAGGRLRPTDRREKADYQVAPGDSLEAASGELVLAEVIPGGRPHGLRAARVIERLGDMANPRSVSLIAIHSHDIPCDFPEAALAQAEAADAAPLDGRADLRAVPLITIDGADARDFDDAVWAAPADGGGWHLMVAIADVAWYVRPGDALDREAFRRGNSVYFPDRVVPMLPEALSNGWCSLKPDEDRPCLVAHLWIDADGNKIRHRFERALMRSAARLTYEQVQQAHDGQQNGQQDGPAAALCQSVLTPLYGAWAALARARSRRGVLDLDLPERQVVIGADGRIDKVVPRIRLDSHRLIEDFMIAANVAAAEHIESLGRPCMYRVHDLPSMEKLDGLREFLSSMGLSLAKGQVLKAEAFNRILQRAKELPEVHLINEVVLRAQAQAAYAPDNLGHFGLSLARYAHFTSPIRRYADLLVHRAILGILPPDSQERFGDIGTHISATERRAAAAERDALNRFTALFLADQVGAVFPGRVNGVTRFGLFVTLDDSGADGLVPVSSLPNDYYVHDEARHCLIGKRFRKTFTLGDSLRVKLAEANPLTGSLIFHLDDKATRTR